MQGLSFAGLRQNFFLWEAWVFALRAFNWLDVTHLHQGGCIKPSREAESIGWLRVCIHIHMCVCIYIYIYIISIRNWFIWLWSLRSPQIFAFGKLESQKSWWYSSNPKTGKINTKKSQDFSLSLKAGKDWECNSGWLVGKGALLTPERVGFTVLFRPSPDWLMQLITYIREENWLYSVCELKCPLYQNILIDTPGIMLDQISRHLRLNQAWD